MNIFFNFLGFIKENLNGKNTHIFIVVVLTLLLYKILGFLGLLIGFMIAIGSDVCGTFNLKNIYDFFKMKFFPFLLITFIITSCGANKNVLDTQYSVSQMLQISKDTVSSQEYRNMVSNNQIPLLSKFSKSYLKNTEENKVNTYYVYYDYSSCKLFNVKELINRCDTLYIIEQKLIKE